MIPEILMYPSLFAVCFFAILCARPVAAQALVEFALGAGRAATSTAPAGRAAGSMSGIAAGLDKALKSAGYDPAATAGSTSKYAPPKAASAKAFVGPKLPPPVYEDPLGIQTGLAYDEVLRRFGPPAIEFGTGPSTRTLSYPMKSGVVQVECEGGKVASVDKPNS
jgi:hypothetical protein